MYVAGAGCDSTKPLLINEQHQSCAVTNALNHTTVAASNIAAYRMELSAPGSAGGHMAHTVRLRARMADGRTFNLSCRPSDVVEHVRERVALLAGLPADASSPPPRLLFRGQLLRQGIILNVDAAAC